MIKHKFSSTLSHLVRGFPVLIKKKYKKELHKTSSFLRGKPTEETKTLVQPKQPIETKKLPEGNKNL